MVFWGACNGRKVEREIKKRHKETFEADRYIHYLNHDGGCMGVYICQNLSNCTLQICAVHCISTISHKIFKN